MNGVWMSTRGLEPWTGVDASIAALLPQRSPLLLVDRVIGVRTGASPAVAASLEIRGDEPVLAGHFPGRPVWPGSYTIEGLAQTCALAGRLCRDQSGTTGSDNPEVPIMFVAGVKMKLTGLVTPPARLTYFVEMVNVTGDLVRFAAEAWVLNREIATGSIDVVVREGVPVLP